MKPKLEKMERKLDFRSHGEGDIDLRVKWLNDKKVTKFLGGDPDKKTNRAEQEKWMAEYLSDPTKKFFTILYENKPVGLLGYKEIDKQEKKAELFIMLGEESVRGKGLGRGSMEWMIDYGFNQLNLDKLELGVLRQNEPALKLYQSLGFKEALEKSSEDDVWIILEKDNNETEAGKN